MLLWFFLTTVAMMSLLLPTPTDLGARSVEVDSWSLLPGLLHRMKEKISARDQGGCLPPTSLCVLTSIMMMWNWSGEGIG